MRSTQLRSWGAIARHGHIGNTLAGAFGVGFDDDGKRKGPAQAGTIPGNDPVPGGPDAVGRQKALAERLVQRDAQRGFVGTGKRNAEKIQKGGNLRFPAPSAGALGDVEKMSTGVAASREGSFFVGLHGLHAAAAVFQRFSNGFNVSMLSYSASLSAASEECPFSGCRSDRPVTEEARQD